MLATTPGGWTARSTASLQSLRLARRRYCGSTRDQKQGAWAVSSANGAVPANIAAAAEPLINSMDINGVPYIRMDEVYQLLCLSAHDVF
jgi:hypothetical protein